MYTPNLGLGVTVLVLAREHGRFRGSTEGVGGSIEGAKRNTEGARGSKKEHYRVVQRRSRREYGSLKWLAQLSLWAALLIFQQYEGDVPPSRPLGSCSHVDKNVALTVTRASLMKVLYKANGKFG